MFVSAGWQLCVSLDTFWYLSFFSNAYSSMTHSHKNTFFHILGLVIRLPLWLILRCSPLQNQHTSFSYIFIVGKTVVHSSQHWEVQGNKQMGTQLSKQFSSWISWVRMWMELTGRLSSHNNGFSPSLCIGQCCFFLSPSHKHHHSFLVWLWFYKSASPSVHQDGEEVESN